MTRHWLAVLLVSSFVWLAAGQPAGAQGETEVKILSVDDSAFPTVSAVVTAEHGGVPIGDLAPRDLSVQETGANAVPLEIKRAVETDLPLAVVVAIDISGSMQDGGTLEKAKAAAITLINNLRPIDQVAVIAFGDQVITAQPLTLDHTAAVAAITGFGIDGATALYDAVVTSSQLAASSGVDRRAVVLLTDGEESGDGHQYGRNDSFAAAASSATPFYVVGVGTDVDQVYLADVARRSGGRYFPAVGAADVPNVYAALEEVLRSQTVVTVHSNAPGGTRDRSIVVTVDRGGSRASDELDYTSRRPPGAGQSGRPVWPFFAVGGVAVLVILFVAARRRRSAVATGGPLGATTDNVIQHSGPLPEEDVEAQLLLVAGPSPTRNGAGPEHAFPVGSAPVAIGSGASCGVRVPPEPGVAAEHARVWLRDGRLMLHHVAPGVQTDVGGQPVQWASLSDGDELRIGPYMFQCHISARGRAR